MTVFTSSRAKSRSLFTFFILAFAISWAIEIPLALEARGVINTPIPFSSHYLAALGPLAAAIITTWLTTGHDGLQDLVRRMFLWRVPVRWWLAAIAPLIMFVVVAAVLSLLLGSWSDVSTLGQIDFLPYQGLAALLWWIVTFGLGEETGWRGFALPRLQRDYSAFWATIILWFFWALWHLPMFFYLYDVTILAGFLIGLLAGTIILTWFYNSTGGSILLAAVWHGTFNFVTGCVSCKTSIAAAIISTLVMVLAIVILVKYKPATLSARKKQVYLFLIVIVFGLLHTACVPAIIRETAVLPEPALTAELEIMSHFPTREKVDLKFTLQNNADTALYVLKWYTPLEGIFGEIFIVQRDGRALPYAGPLVMRGDPAPDDYVLLEPGASVSRVVNLAAAYDFAHEGEYAIAFVSPLFSHVARSEAEMAKTVDDLGQIVIPSNQVSVQVGSLLTVTNGRTRAEAAEMIQAYLHAQKPDPYPEALVTVEELPIPGVWESLSAQLFRITEGPSLNESFLIHGDSVLQLGMAFGGRGLIRVEIADLDQDGHAELLFAYRFGSGIHQSRIGMYAPAYDDGRIYEANNAYLGDLNLYKEDTGKIGVRVVESNDATMTLSFLDPLGHLVIDQQDGEVVLQLQIAEGLPDEVRQKIFGVN